MPIPGSSPWTERSPTPPATADFIENHPDRFFEMFIAEQQMVAAATGLATRGHIAYASTFAAFLTRAADFIRHGPRLPVSTCG